MYLAEYGTKGQIPIPTFAGEYLEGVLSDGTSMRCDQISRNPPSNEVTVIGPDGNFSFKSTCTLYGGVSPVNFNKFNGSRSGTTTVTFKDGDTYEIVYPSFSCAFFWTEIFLGS